MQSMKIVRSKLQMFLSSIRILPLPNGMISLKFMSEKCMVHGRLSWNKWFARSCCGDAAPRSAADHPHSEAAKSIQGEQASRLSHTYPLYQRDNDQLYSMLEVAARGKPFEAIIKPFRMAHNRRGAYLAQFFLCAGNDKWNFALKTAKDYVNNRKWDGTTEICQKVF